VDLLVSGLTPDGGVFRVNDNGCERLDTTPTMGMAQTDRGLFCARLGFKEARVDRLEGGRVAESWLVPGGAHPHDVTLDRGALAVTDTLHDRIVWLDLDDGSVLDQWQATELGDAWHVNTLLPGDDRLYATHFGRFDGNRGWFGHGPERKGELIEVSGDGPVVLRGLSAPHSPRRFGDNWLIVNTFEGALSLVAPDSSRLVDVVLGGWPVGLALVDGVAWVGVGDSHRLPSSLPPHGCTPGKLVGVSTKTWKVVAEVPLPFSGVYAVQAFEL